MLFNYFHISLIQVKVTLVCTFFIYVRLKCLFYNVRFFYQTICDIYKISFTIKICCCQYSIVKKYIFKW